MSGSEGSHSVQHVSRQQSGLGLNISLLELSFFFISSVISVVTFCHSPI
jgi:hypothetical protein